MISQRSLGLNQGAEAKQQQKEEEEGEGRMLGTTSERREGHHESFEIRNKKQDGGLGCGLALHRDKLLREREFMMVDLKRVLLGLGWSLLVLTVFIYPYRCLQILDCLLLSSFAINTNRA